MHEEGVSADVTSHLQFSAVPILEEAEYTALTAASTCNMFVFYPYAFAVRCNGGVIDEQAFVELSVALLFNLGQSHHVRAFRNSASCKNDLKEALRHYNYAITLLKMKVSLCAGSASSYLLTLALLNNVGHAYSDLGQMKQARSSLDGMENLLDGEQFNHIPEDHAEFFSSSVFFSQSYQIKAAAAA